ncbi:helix-turn-helix domain-containing protein [Salinarchaeum sp. IM2453]|uniref:MarR family transcriptional regulator n=1 Tax=Salinarchaeum sp. IM2453 TaxID=2862870 RepID=UPI001C835BA8|nr:MarR family transcriptional regulator [Salinarchaeum sp. IM2453]QZA89065.1 helix-turn-helix domain-containing protein [Salinarchaeum sp. IM2453]
MVNQQHEPSEYEERVLEVLKEGRDDDRPWGYTTPSRVAERFDIPRQRINEAIGRLEAAGWIEQVEENGTLVRGLYSFVDDPREH